MSQEQEPSALKPCPFCGKDAERKQDDYKVACSDSGTCPASQQWSDPDDWNRRATAPSESEAVRAAKEAVVRALEEHAIWCEVAGQKPAADDARRRASVIRAEAA